MTRRFTARIADSFEDVQAAQALRGRVFRQGQADVDAFDERCIHVLVEDQVAGRIVCTFRIQPFENGAEISRSYAAQFYELSALKAYAGKLVEMGRFCMDPSYNDPDILRAAWGVMTTYVDENKVKMLFGCSSFHGAEAEAHLEAFALLKARHLAPRKYLPQIKAPKVFRFARLMRKPNLRAAQNAMPPLLRTYLMMGGWTSDHAVVDRDLDTLHVFTGLEIGTIPAARKRLLRAVRD
ncbi:MAG: GNAT family N-acetyltransferase [Rhodobacteraceae bacterium]|nr:GNAT family N-acetyltransferase [Paracoccaceae bacterium]